ncbi:MAG: STAS domain-containing protein [Oscillospiraceae bacterium]|nr:STAS domain-containing protein [Oscillospiraceae bacterium]
MTITKTDGKTIVWAIEGRLEAESGLRLQRELEAAWDTLSKDLVFDFTGLTYISSAGLRVLLMTEKKARARGVQFSISGANQMVREIFDITGFSSVLSIV